MHAPAPTPPAPRLHSCHRQRPLVVSPPPLSPPHLSQCRVQEAGGAAGFRAFARCKLTLPPPALPPAAASIMPFQSLPLSRWRAIVQPAPPPFNGHHQLRGAAGRHMTRVAHSRLSRIAAAAAANAGYPRDLNCVYTTQGWSSRLHRLHIAAGCYSTSS